MLLVQEPNSAAASDESSKEWELRLTILMCLKWVQSSSENPEPFKRQVEMFLKFISEKYE